jgi:hypothetical protein
MMRNAFPLLCLGVVVASAQVAFADTIVIKGGRRFEGEIVDEGDDYVDLRLRTGVVRFEKSKVQEIVRSAPSDTPPVDPKPAAPPAPRVEPPKPASAKTPAEFRNRYEGARVGQWVRIRETLGPQMTVTITHEWVTRVEAARVWTRKQVVSDESGRYGLSAPTEEACHDVTAVDQPWKGASAGTSQPFSSRGMKLTVQVVRIDAPGQSRVWYLSNDVLGREVQHMAGAGARQDVSRQLIAYGDSGLGEKPFRADAATKRRLTDELNAPLAHARVGQWALYKGGVAPLHLMWVDKVEGRKVTIHTQVLFDQLHGQGPPVAMVVDLDAPELVPFDAVKDLGTEELHVAGRTLSCRKSELTTILGAEVITTTSWTCNEVPLWGSVRSQKKTGATSALEELVAFGDSGGSPRPVGRR